MEPTKEQYEKYTSDFCDFSHKSPDPFHAAKNEADILENRGFTRLYENESWKLCRGGSYYFLRNDCCLIAFKLPKEEFSGFKIFSCHGDSPAFKIKENPERKTAPYVTLNVERYGGTVPYLWFDRPLSVSGRVFVKTDCGAKMKLVNFGRPLLLIPSLAPHLRTGEEIYSKIKIQKEIQPLISGDAEFSLRRAVANELGVSPDDIISHDLFATNCQEGEIFGGGREFFCCPRIDDLLCAYGGLLGFADGQNASPASVYALFDNEEVGSSSRQGALSDILRLTLSRINSSLGIPESRLFEQLANSFALSADNGHALHPNFPEKADPTNRPVLGGGILIKHSANQKYTTDGLSSAVFKTILEREGIPFQTFVNHSDIPGGSTLGNLSGRQVSVASADIGMAQLAMHSPCEIGTVKDVYQLYAGTKSFFSSSIKFLKDGGFSIDRKPTGEA